MLFKVNGKMAIINLLRNETDEFIGYVNPETNRAQIYGVPYVKENVCTIEPSFCDPVTVDDVQEWVCSECNEYTIMQVLTAGEHPNFCSNCGARVDCVRSI